MTSTTAEVDQGELPDLGRALGTAVVPLATDPADVGVARAAVGSFCADYLGRDQIEDALVAVSEMVTNAQEHGGSPLCLTIRGYPDGVAITVADGQGGAEAIARNAGIVPAEVKAEGMVTDIDAVSVSGRGLFLIDALATAWTARQAPGRGTEVVAVFITGSRQNA